MPNYIRAHLAGSTVFFTVNAYCRRSIFLDSKFRMALRQAIQITRQEKPFEILAWTLLPDHLHCIWRLPNEDDEISLRWSMIDDQKASF